MTIRIQKEALATAKGTHMGCNHKPVCCITTGTVYVSLRDAALSNGIDPGALSRAISQKRYIKGMRFCFVADMAENFEAITEVIRTTNEKARAYDAIIEHQKAIEKAEDDVRKGEIRLEQLRQQTQCVEEMLEEAKRRLSELKGDAV